MGADHVDDRRLGARDLVHRRSGPRRRLRGGHPAGDGGDLTARLADERGSAVAEFSMVAALLTVLVLAVVQLGLGLLVRNTVRDAAAEGARHGALLGAGPEAGEERTRMLIRAALADEYAADVHAVQRTVDGVPVIEVVVRTPLPVIGLIGPLDALEVRGHAAVETLG